MTNDKNNSFEGRQNPIEIREQDGTLRMRVKVQPKASADAIVGEHAGALKIRVAAAPEDGKANRAAVKFLAGKLGLRRSDITIISGEHSRDKLFAIQGLTKGEILHRLQSLQTTLE
ncbi:MAG: DUF167 domain-containing protein [Candidatus Aureabacteria bacterium]|nr:DUF167 domain-containing protein [Candidatus Auribacterota bacterium]